MHTRLQFRVLYRHFLFRLMDVELLSASAHGDSNELLGQFGALLIFGSFLLAGGALTVGQAVSRRGLPGPLWTMERFLVSLTMLTVGAFALLSWDSTFPDRRDVAVLAPLPVSGRTLFTARIAAVASALGLTVAALNSLAGFAWPLMLAPPTAGILGILRFVAAFWIAVTAAGAFLYCGVLSVQALVARLPRRWYLRISPLVQIAGFMLLLGVFCLQPSFATPAALGSFANRATMAWLPSYWFMGLLSELSGAFPAAGHAVMGPLAHRAVAGLGIAIFAAAGAFPLSYMRTLRKIADEPDIAAGARGGIWLPRFGNSPQTGIAQFVIRTLLRSRRHRVILGFYLGGGFAVVCVYLTGAREALHLTWLDSVRLVNVPMLVSSVLLLCAWMAGTRVAFSLPIDLGANWLFRLIPALPGAGRVAAVRLALITLSVLPVLMAFGALAFWLWPWQAVAEHLLVLGLLGSILADVSLTSHPKIPFTCSYLPGKSKVHMVFWFGIIPLVIAIHQLVELERAAMTSATGFWTMTVMLATTALFARRFAGRGAKKTQFEQPASDEVIVLGLNG